MPLGGGGLLGLNSRVLSVPGGNPLRDQVCSECEAPRWSICGLIKNNNKSGVRVRSGCSGRESRLPSSEVISSFVWRMALNR